MREIFLTVVGEIISQTISHTISHINSTAFKEIHYKAVQPPDETWGEPVSFRGDSPRSSEKALPL